MIDYIIKTLQKDKLADVNGLGNFKVELKHATIADNIINPPHYEVVFTQNQDLTNNFLLANTICAEEKCLYTDANEKINSWTSELLKALENNKSITFEDFGTFMLDKKGKIHFESAVIPQLNTNFEGLESVNFKQLLNASDILETQPEETAQEEIEQSEVPETEISVQPEVTSQEDSEQTEVPEIENLIQSEETIQEDSEQIEVPEIENSIQSEEIKQEEIEQIEVTETEIPVQPEVTTQEDSEEIIDDKEDEIIDDEDEDDDDDENDDDDYDEKRKKTKLSWLWILLLLIMVLCALGFIFKDKLIEKYHNIIKKEHNTEQIIETSDSESEIEIETGTTEIVEPELETSESTDFDNVEAYEPTAIKQSANGKYDYIKFEEGKFYAIAGSFYREQDLEKHIKQKNLDQYSPKILIQDGVKNLRVCIGIFDIEEEAENFAKDINEGYWVLK